MKNQQAFLALAALLASAQSDTGFSCFAGGCGDCDPAYDYPTPVDGFNTELEAQAGGISILYILKKSDPFTDPTDSVEWSVRLNPVAPATPSMVALAGCYNTGGLEQEANEQTLGSCLKPVRTRDTNTLTFEVIEDNASKDVFALIASLKNPSLANCFQYGYQTCDGEVTGFFDATFRATRQIENTKDGKKRWTIVLTWDSVQDPLPLVLAFDPATLIP